MSGSWFLYQRAIKKTAVVSSAGIFGIEGGIFDADSDVRFQPKQIRRLLELFRNGTLSSGMSIQLGAHTYRFSKQDRSSAIGKRVGDSNSSGETAGIVVYVARRLILAATSVIKRGRSGDMRDNLVSCRAQLSQIALLLEPHGW